jgi:hypothetical protein
LKPWLRRARLPILLLFLGLGALNVYMCGADRQKKAEARELVDYFGRTWPGLHVEVRSIQAGLVGLVDDTAPSARGAIVRLNEQIVPSLDRVIEVARSIAPAEESARLMHREYLTALEVTREDALRIRAIFAEPTGQLHAKRERTATILRELNLRYEGFYARAVAVCATHGIALKAPADAGTASSAP